MLISETISVSLFLSVIAVIYTREASLLLRLASNKLKNKQGNWGLLSKSAIGMHFLALIGVICFLWAYFIEPYRIEVKTIDIFTEKFKNTSLTIVQISDLHCDKKVRNETKLADIINPLEPDIIVFTGDTVNAPEALSMFEKTMKQLNANLGKYAVKGNWDTWYWDDLDLFSNTDFKVLDEDNVRLEKDGETFYISGLNYRFLDKQYELLKNIPAEKYSIFLYHSPDLIESLKGINVDLYLAGHTHGGQLALPFYGALVTLSKYGKRYEAGEYTVDNTILYVNRGIGMEGGFAPRVRFLSRPEITIFNINPKRESLYF